MTHIEQMIQDLCPNGVEFKTLGEVTRTLPKGTLKTTDLTEEGYPVINSGKSLYGYYSNFNNECEALTIAARGEYAGWISYFNEKFWAGGLCYPYTSKDENLVKTKFIYYWLKKQECNIMDNLVARGSIPALNKSDLDKFPIPLPPLEIQKKIVECLDKFSALAAELQAELQKRRTQYEFYRTRLLTPPPTESNSADNTDDRNWEWKTFAELGAFYGGLSGKTKEDFKDGNAKYITYLNIGCNPALRFDILETVKVGPNERQNTIQYGDALFTGSSETPDECAMSSVVTEQPTENIYLNSFCFGFRFNSLDGICPAFYKHYFRCDAFRNAVRRTANGTTRFNVSKKEFAKLSIPIPPIAEQKRIADILDKFEKLISSMEDGIPAEQAAQQKRYEYYRDLLLTFDRKAV